MAILNVIFPVPFPDVFAALTTTNAPLVVAVVGVPLMSPEVAFKLNPSGNVPLATA